MANLLELVQEAADRIGLTQPTAVIGSTDAQVRNFRGVAQQEGRNLAKRHAWQSLLKERTFTTTATEAQTGALPSDLDYIIPGTVYDRTATRIVTGPLTAQEYADYKGRLTSIVYAAYRLRGGQFVMLPTQTAGHTIAFEYKSKWWCGGASATAPTQASWTADTDIAFLDEEALRLGIIWRFKKSRGLDYGEDFASYEDHVAKIMGQDNTARTLIMGNNDRTRRPRPPQVPDGSWPL